MSGPPILLLYGVLLEALQNSSAAAPTGVLAACRKSLTVRQLRALAIFGPASAFDGLVGVIFTPRRSTVTRTAVESSCRIAYIVS
jgi:hypothetical protein